MLCEVPIVWSGGVDCESGTASVLCMLGTLQEKTEVLLKFLPKEEEEHHTYSSRGFISSDHLLKPYQTELLFRLKNYCSSSKP